MPGSFPEAALVPTLSHEEAPVSALYQEKVPGPTSSPEVADRSLQEAPVPARHKLRGQLKVPENMRLYLTRDVILTPLALRPRRDHQSLPQLQKEHQSLYLPLKNSEGAPVPACIPWKAPVPTSSPERAPVHTMSSMEAPVPASSQEEAPVPASYQEDEMPALSQEEAPVPTATTKEVLVPAMPQRKHQCLPRMGVLRSFHQPGTLSENVVIFLCDGTTRHHSLVICMHLLDKKKH